ncbi:MAG: fibronectin type III domain-containing protein [Actinobacteria bacterium]|nr:fibronectin type III domain-containing protein [Actinomycetota bacterium]
MMGGALAGKQVVQVATGAEHACALTKDGLVACWGKGSGGALGNQPSASSNVPVAVFAAGVLAGQTITQISAGGDFTCAVASGAVFCWGANAGGQLGDGTTTSRPIPVKAVASGASALAGKTVTEVSAGLDHACALSSDATLACWGSNVTQQVIPSTTVKQVLIPTVADQGDLAGRRVTQVSAGAQITCAVASGSVVCWGLNQSGQMANGPVSTTPQAVPSLVTTKAPSALAGKTVATVSSGLGHVCAVTTDGAIACWGWGNTGQLGTVAPAAGLTVPFSVTGNPGSGVMRGAIARGVATGFYFTVGLTSSLPDGPTSVAAKAGSAQATVSWVAPASTGGSPITSFVVQQSTDAGSTWTATAGSPTAATATSLVVAGLPNGVNVTFRAAAVTAVGQGPFSTATSVVRPEAPPATASPTLTPTATPSAPAISKPGAVQALAARNAPSRVVVLSWRPPVTGTAPSSYQVRRKQGGDRFSAWTTVTATTLTIRKLRKGKRYSFAVRAANAAGFGPGVVVRRTIR